MAHKCYKILRTYTLNRSTVRAARIKVQVCYIKIIIIESVTIWASWRTQPTEIKVARIGFLVDDLGLIYWVSYAFVIKSKCLGFELDGGRIYTY